MKNSGLVVAAAWAMIGGSASAVTLPPPQYYEGADQAAFIYGTYDDDVPVARSTDGSNLDFRGNYDTSSISGLPSVSSTSITGLFAFDAGENSNGTEFIVTPPDLTGLSQGSESQLTYSFTVTGPSDQVVPLTALFNASVSAVHGLGTGGSRAFASGLLNGAIAVPRVNGYYSYGVVLYSDYPQISSNVPSLVPFSIETGAIGTVSLDAETYTSIHSPGDSAYASAYVDPYIAIDSSWAAANPGSACPSARVWETRRREDRPRRLNLRAGRSS